MAEIPRERIARIAEAGGGLTIETPTGETIRLDGIPGSVALAKAIRAATGAPAPRWVDNPAVF